MKTARSMFMIILHTFIYSIFIIAFAHGVMARDLTIALRKGASTLDPHFVDNSPNNTAIRHIFDSIVGRDERLQPIPSLAVSWLQLDPLTWRFKFREGVTFHDGSPFSADDAAASIERAKLSNRDGSYTAYVQYVKTMRVIDDRTLDVVTSTPDPLLPNRLTNIFVVKRSSLSQAQEVFDSGAAAVGTGPYRFQEWLPGKHLVVAANPTHWRGTPIWDKVTIVNIPDAAERVAALLTHKADVIDQVRKGHSDIFVDLGPTDSSANGPVPGPDPLCIGCRRASAAD